jgi:type II secretory pathway pseudopilin PulG
MNPTALHVLPPTARASRARRLLGAVRRTRAFTLLEGLIATLVVALVASAAAVAVSVGMATQEDNRLAVFAMHAAELQLSSCLEASYDGMNGLAGTEAQGQMRAPARPGSTARPLLPESFAALSRITTITPETRTFAQYNNISIEGKRINIRVFGPSGNLLAELTRFRAREDQL